ncbi:MAG: XdhC family protein [Fusobacteriaceae bacterium]
MDSRTILEVGKKIEKGEGVALVTLIRIDGSSPGKKGSIMGVFQDGTISGTVGGGNLEYTLIKEGLKAIDEGVSKELEFKLVEEAALHMKCGGDVKAFIKIFNKKDKVIIVGGGHVGGELYKVLDLLGMDTVIVDDREAFCNRELYPNAKELLVGEVREKLLTYSLDNKSYVVIVTRGHKYDKESLKSVIGRGAKYIGMIGSKKKVKETLEELLNEGVSKELLNEIYSPIGLDISNGSPKEIAISVVSEILKVKNNLTGISMRDKLRGD